MWILYLQLLLTEIFLQAPNTHKTFFFCPHLWHMEVPRLGVPSELHLPAYTTATATRDPSHICNLHHGSWQRWILNPLSEAGDQTHILMVISQICYCWATTGTQLHSQPGRVSVVAEDLVQCHFLWEASLKPPEWVRCSCQSVDMLIRLLSLFSFSEKCHGPCTPSSNCSQPCAQHFRGEIRFTCNGNEWQKLTETCTSLSVETLFQVIHLHICILMAVLSESILKDRVEAFLMFSVQHDNKSQIWT